MLTQPVLTRLKSVADELWRVADELSIEAGHPYTNREGTRVFPKGIPVQLVNDVISIWTRPLGIHEVTAPTTPLVTAPQ